jgi:DMATS type aromatic prenyltransferase
MDEAGYDLQCQYANLIFHLHHIVPRLGPANGTASTLAWRSFMTDDFSPLEYSWNWDTPASGPKVRYSVELVGPNAGNSIDPFNQTSTVDLSRRLRRQLPGMDLTLFEIMRTTFYDEEGMSISAERNSDYQSSPSSLFLAFELGGSIAAKAYFVPVKAEQYGISRLTVLSEAVYTLRARGYPCMGFERILAFMDTQQGSKLHVVGVAIDCTDSTDSRFKVYLRSPETSFLSVCDMMNLGGTLDVLTPTARAELKQLWRLTLGLAPDFVESDELISTTHETAGVLYNFDIKLRGSSLQPKLYIPVKHYAANDAAAARGLGSYLQERGRYAYFPNYVNALQRTCLHRSLEDENGYQTYIGTGIQKNGSLSLCSYLNGEVYHPKRVWP